MLVSSSLSSIRCLVGPREGSAVFLIEAYSKPLLQLLGLGGKVKLINSWIESSRGQKRLLIKVVRVSDGQPLTCTDPL